MNHTEISWMGYKRKDGRKGIRNRVLVIYTVKCAEHVARKIVDEVHHPEVGVQPCACLVQELWPHQPNGTREALVVLWC